MPMHTACFPTSTPNRPFRLQIYFSMCNHNRAGVCPPAETVLKLKLTGDAPFAGYFPPPADYNWGGLARKVRQGRR